MNAGDLAILLSEEGGREALRRFRVARPPTHRLKADGSIVTDADIAVERLIRDILSEYDPSAGIISEEIGSTVGTGRTWYVDPIDGTENYARGLPIWAVLIACVEGGETTAACVSAPALDMIWQWSVGDIAWGPNGRLLTSVADIGLESASVTLGGWHEPRNATEVQIQALIGATARVAWGYGNFWGHMLVAEGLLDAALSLDTKAWDILAPAAIVCAAGGTARPLWDDEKWSSLVTGSSGVVDDICAIARRVEALSLGQ